jgi:Nuclease subunit of the excinuclease complex
LGEALTAANDHKVTIHLPQRGRKVDLIKHGMENAQTMLARNLAEREAQEDMLKHLGEHFDLDEPPGRIEIYDNSHNQGSKPVGVMVVAGPSGFEKSQYRKYNMDQADIAAGDDYAMMRHMFTRRFGRLARGDNAASPRPDLVLVDGGKGQLAACLGVLEELGLNDIICIGVAKGPDRDAGREQIFVPGKPSYILKPHDPVSYFIQRLRDEAHRFAIGSHRARRARSIQANPLDSIEGIGPTRKKALLTHFGSAKAVARAGINDLLKVEGISRQVAQKVYDHFHES